VKECAVRREKSGADFEIHNFDASLSMARIPLFIGNLKKINKISQLRKPHRHSFYEILFITEGKGTHFIDFEAYDASPGSIFFISPGQIHFYGEDSDLDGFAVLFAEEFLSIDPLIHSFIYQLSYFNIAEKNSLRLMRDDDLAEFKLLFRQVQIQFDTDEFGKESILRNYMQIILIKLQRLYENEYRETGIADSKKVLLRRFRKLINEKFLKERAVIYYARELGISANYLGELIKEQTGFTPGHLIREQITMEAKRHLVHSSKTVEEVACDLEFDDPSYFSRFFRRETGTSPAKFRKVIREKHRNFDS